MQARNYRGMSIILSFLLFLLLGCNLAWAQSSEQKFSFSAEAQANSTTVGNLFTVDPMGSYNHSDHFGIDVGLPIHFTRDPSFFSNSSMKPMWNDGVSDPYVRFRYMRDYSGVTFATMATGSAPVGSFTKGLNTGRVGVDWFNHVDVAVHKLTPFGNVGLANGLLDRHFLTGPYSGFRPFQTLGFVSDLEGGATYALHRRLSVGGSAFEILPSGHQKIFSRLVAQGMFVPGPVEHNRFFEHQFETAGPSSIARDDGFSGWGTLALNHNLDVQLGYTRSTHYALNSLGVTLAFNPSSFTRVLWR
jgi:hypothetical protein